MADSASVDFEDSDVIEIVSAEEYDVHRCLPPSSFHLNKILFMITITDSALAQGGAEAWENSTQRNLLLLGWRMSNTAWLGQDKKVCRKSKAALMQSGQPMSSHHFSADGTSQLGSGVFTFFFGNFYLRVRGWIAGLADVSGLELSDRRCCWESFRDSLEVSCSVSEFVDEISLEQLDSVDVADAESIVTEIFSLDNCSERVLVVYAANRPFRGELSKRTVCCCFNQCRKTAQGLLIEKGVCVCNVCGQLLLFTEELGLQQQARSCQLYRGQPPTQLEMKRIIINSMGDGAL
ncbi:hypothetical protein BaRGS_00019541 [Batillaria attramentaria]|uniref:Uncharacterized protein n=1 Tax=Batillaria attramentaria TaxID=370345 RepID=A0ABD0KQG1_9CAEN